MIASSKMSEHGKFIRSTRVAYLQHTDRVFATSIYPEHTQHIQSKE